MTDDSPFAGANLNLFAAMFGAMTTGPSISTLLKQSPEIARALHACHPIKAAATFGSLLTQPQLQSNCLRLEALVHVSLAAARGQRMPTQQMVAQAYVDIGKVIGHLEDPAEDSFVGNICSKRGNYRILNGIWESGDFYLQRFVNIVDDFPDDQELGFVANAVHALLRLSDLVCDRAGLIRNQVGAHVGEARLPNKIAERVRRMGVVLRFTPDELRTHGVELKHLVPFGFHPGDRKALLGNQIGHSALESCPLVYDEGDVYLILPTAVSAAIRRLLIEKVGVGQNREWLLKSLTDEYSAFFNSFPILGDRPSRVPFTRTSWGAFCGMSREIDKGRHLQCIFFQDSLEAFEGGGLGKPFVGSETFTTGMRQLVSEMRAAAEREPNFRDGLTLLVSCGVGRGLSLNPLTEVEENWETIFLSAPDLFVLSITRDMEPLHLWRVASMERALEAMQVWIQNVNGYLNLFAWARSLDGHLVPHASMGYDAEDTPRDIVMAIQQNALLDLRHAVATVRDRHVEQFVDGTWRMVMTEGESKFKEDAKYRQYIHIPESHSKVPLGACPSEHRCWWYGVESPKGCSGALAYQRWEMMGTWLARAIGPMEAAFRDGLGEGPILWRCTFEHAFDLSSVLPIGTTQQAAEAIQVTMDRQRRTIEMRIGAGFDEALHHPENIAERELVAALLSAVAEFAGTRGDHVPGDLLGTIVRNPQARHAHVFAARQFRDFIHALREHKPIYISDFDDAASKLGLGWRVRKPSQGGKIEGKAQCLEYFNALVTALEDDLCAELARFNRIELVGALLFNSEVASASHDRWHRTAAAVIALRDDQGAALSIMNDQEFRLNAIFQPTRNLVEMALCEAPLEGGSPVGDLDLSILLAKMAQLYHISGWSDLIRWGFLQPEAVIRPLGDVHIRQDFIETVMDGFGRASSVYRYLHSAKSYAKHHEELNPVADTSGMIEQQFAVAWEAELGASLDAYRRFVDAVENEGIREQQAVLRLRRSALCAMGDTAETGLIIVEHLTLSSRQAWRVLPDGYDHKDIAPWRFRRRLSMLRRPLLKVSEANDPEYLVAPGILREGLAMIVGNYYHGAYPDRHLGPAMRKYAGFARARDGARFNAEVTARMTELGWQALSEVNVTRILRRALDRNYGDVDVLAWDPETRRVLVMECKDLQFRKTHGEIAEQLSDFRGEISADGKRRDLLRKHLDRIGVLRTHLSEVASFLSFEGECCIESVVVFRHPVPMQFVNGAIRQHATLYIYDTLNELAIELT